MSLVERFPDKHRPSITWCHKSRLNPVWRCSVFTAGEGRNLRRRSKTLISLNLGQEAHITTGLATKPKRREIGFGYSFHLSGDQACKEGHTFLHFKYHQKHEGGFADIEIQEFLQPNIESPLQCSNFYAFYFGIIFCRRCSIWSS